MPFNVDASPILGGADKRERPREGEEGRSFEERPESLLAPSSFADGWIFEGKALQGQQG